MKLELHQGRYKGMRKLLMVVLVPIVIVIVIDYFTNTLDFIIYYAAIGFIVIGLDLFTYGYYHKIKDNSKLLILSKVIIFLPSYIFLLNITSLDNFFPTNIIYYVVAFVFGIPFTIIIFKQFFIKHIAYELTYEQKFKYKK